MSAAFALRDARPGDGAAIARLVRALADYERLLDAAVATPDHFERALFCPNPRVHALIAEAGGEPVGFALYFFNFSTFLGRHGLYLEDLFVEPAHRGAGIGRALVAALAARAVAENCGRMEWSVLDSNEPAIRLYRSLGAVGLEEWTTQRLTGDALTRLAQGGSGP